MGHLIIRRSRFQVVDFSFVPYFLTGNLVTARPKKLPQYYNLSKPFDTKVWLAAISAMVIMTGISYLIIKSGTKLTGEKQVVDIQLIALAVIGVFIGECKSF